MTLASQIIRARCLALGRALVQQQGAFAALQSLQQTQPACNPWRCASTAAQPGRVRQRQASSSTSWAIPSAGPETCYEVSLVIKGFELRFVKQASTVIRDLLLLCFAPKSIYQLPEDLRSGAGQLRSVADTPVALALPLGDRPLRTRRTLVTLACSSLSEARTPITARAPRNTRAKWRAARRRAPQAP